jgi:hypothetical protein
MSFLDEVESAGLGGLKLAAPLLGGIGSGFVATPFHVIAGLVLAAEAAGGVCKQAGAGKVDKLSFVVETAKQVLLDSPLFKTKTVINQDSYTAGVTQLVDGIVQVMKSMETRQPIQDQTKVQNAGGTTTAD